MNTTTHAKQLEQAKPTAELLFDFTDYMGELLEQSTELEAIAHLSRQLQKDITASKAMFKQANNYMAAETLQRFEFMSRVINAVLSSLVRELYVQTHDMESEMDKIIEHVRTLEK